MSGEKKDNNESFFIDNCEEASGGDSSTTADPKDQEESAQRKHLRQYLSRSLGLSDPPERVLEDLSLEGVAKSISDGKAKDILTMCGAGISTSEWFKRLKEDELKNRPPQQLDELSIKGIAKFIREKKCHNIMTMVGAGISTSAGIPDFRSPDTGLYDNLEKYNLPNPQAVFDIEYFKGNQEPFYTLAREIWPGLYKPTPCHYFIKMLHDKGLLLRHYTQNIDSLEFVAGLDPEKMVEAHGTFRFAHCLNCNEVYRQDWMEEKVFAEVIPTCENCNGVVKPDIVFFGEGMTDKFKNCVEEDFSKCDLLIILGTSLVVQPFASVTNKVSETTPRLYINLEKTGTGSVHPLMALIFGGGFKFDDKDNYRDVFWQGTCDDGCYKLADLLGWGDEFRKMVKDNNARMDKSIVEQKKRLAKLKAMADSIKSGKPSRQTEESLKNDAKSRARNNSSTSAKTETTAKIVSSKTGTAASKVVPKAEKSGPTHKISFKQANSKSVVSSKKKV